jgi:hypothetical protein
MVSRVVGYIRAASVKKGVQERLKGITRKFHAINMHMGV